MPTTTYQRHSAEFWEKTVAMDVGHLILSETLCRERSSVEFLKYGGRNGVRKLFMNLKIALNN